jgi:hypothetical protein
MTCLVYIIRFGKGVAFWPQISFRKAVAADGLEKLAASDLALSQFLEEGGRALPVPLILETIVYGPGKKHADVGCRMPFWKGFLFGGVIEIRSIVRHRASEAHAANLTCSSQTRLSPAAFGAQD